MKIHRRGPTKGLGALVVRPPPWSHHLATWEVGPPPGSPFSYIYLTSRNFTGRNPFLKTYLCSATVVILISGGDRRTCSGTLPEEEDHLASLYVAMTTSRMMCE